MNIIIKNNNPLVIFILFTIVGLALRIWISQFGSNFDFAMWQAHLEIFKSNKSIYEIGYAYASPWLHTLYLLDSIPFPLLENSTFVQNLPGSFYRIKIVIFLSLIDFFIFLLLFKNYSLKIGLLFFLNPISIIITGHHNQFTNFALLFGFLSVLLYEKNNLNLKIILPLIIMGLSLSIKHVLIFFPIWWAFKEKKLLNKFLVLFVPYSIFIISFLPLYYPGDLEHIINGLCCFSKRLDGPFWGMFGSKFIHMYLDLQTLFSLILIILGFLFINKNLKDSFYLYLMAVVTFSSMMYTQYLVIPLIALAVFWNWKYFFYTLLTFLVFLVDGDQLNIQFLRELTNWDLRSTRISFYPIILILLVGFVEKSIGTKRFNLYLKNLYNFLKDKVKTAFYFEKI